jgi:hypothetical protein
VKENNVELISNVTGKPVELVANEQSLPMSQKRKENTTKILRQPETVGKSIAGDDMKYGDKIIRMEGVIVEVHDGCVGIDLKGRLGYLKVPMRMLITDYPVKVGQEVAWNMSFVEQMGPEINEKYMSNLMTYQKRQEKNACEQ